MNCLQRSNQKILRGSGFVIPPCYGNSSCDHAIRSSVVNVGIDIDSGSASEARSVLTVGSASLGPSWVDAEFGTGGFTIFSVNCGNLGHGRHTGRRTDVLARRSASVLSSSSHFL